MGRRPDYLGLVTDFCSLSDCCCFDYIILRGSTFFFVKSKTFEFSVEEGGTFNLLRILEKGRDSSRFVTLGKESAKRLLFNVEELASKQSPVQFSRTFREGDKILLFSWGPMLVEIFCLFLNSFTNDVKVHSDTGRKIGKRMGQIWSSPKEDIRRFSSPTRTFQD